MINHQIWLEEVVATKWENRLASSSGKDENKTLYAEVKFLEESVDVVYFVKKDDSLKTFKTLKEAITEYNKFE